MYAPAPPKYELYAIQTFTGEVHKPVARARIFATLHGITQRERVPLVQTSEEKKHITFGKGMVDTFYVVLPEIVGLNGITLHCEDIQQRGWFVEQVIVKASGRSYVGTFNYWVRNELYQPLVLQADHTKPFMEGRILLGPWLKFRGYFGDCWNVSAMVVTENVLNIPGTIQFWFGSNSYSSSPPICFYQQWNYQMWRFDFHLPVIDTEQVCVYQLPGLEAQFSFHVPSRNQKPGILFCSCNDRAHPYQMTPNENIHKSVGWKYMIQQLAKSKYHLLIMGGDQIYADSLFAACESVRAWDVIGSKEEKYFNSAKYFSSKTVEELNCYYFKMYLFCWGYEATQAAAASVPTAMMYDDHDIFDGWGSLDPHVNDSDMMLNIFKVAKKYFFLFQMQGELSSAITERMVPDDPYVASRMKDTAPFEPFGYPQLLNDQGPFNVALNMTGGVSVVLLDLRTERRMFTHDEGIIMTENSYQNFEKFLYNRTSIQQQQHMFVVLTVPIHYPDASVLNKLFDMTHHNLIDDVRDHYSAVIHRREQARVLNDLATFCANSFTGTRASILSGDVHLGCYSVAEVGLRNSKTVKIEQYISSGIAAKPPPLFAQRMMRTPIFRNKDKYESELSSIVQEMCRLPSGKYFFRSSNFLCLNPVLDTYNAMWVGCPKLKKTDTHKFQEENPLPAPITFSRNID